MIYDLWLASAKISNKGKKELLKIFGTPEELFQNFFENYELLKEEKSKTALKEAWDLEKLKKIEEIIIKNEIKYILFNQKDYPKSLEFYEDKPWILFFKGNLKALDCRKNVSLVGARNFTYYGEEIARRISKELSLRKINIISGLARGIDSICHKTALEYENFTCGVLGCGLDIVYPRENKELYLSMEKGGCIVSEFMPTTKPLNYNFPQRNKLISALSDLVIVVEAGVKSGSLITARIAAEQGKDVMAVPGSIFSDVSMGCNKLIKDGAFPFTDMEDLFSLLRIDNIEKQDNKEDVSLQKVDGKLRKVLKLISDKPIHIDDIVKVTNIDIQCLYELLFEMQINYGVKSIPGNFYVRFKS